MSLSKDLVDDFSEYMKKNKYLYSQFSQIIKKNISTDKKIINILDIGCGPGLLIEELQKQTSNTKIYGIDVSDHMINTSSKKLSVNKNIYFFKSSVENICFKPNSIDYIVSRFSLCYWKNPEHCFKELKKILKKDGKIIFEILNSKLPKYRLFLIKINMSFKKASDNVIKYHIDAYKKAYNIDQIKIFLKNAGFKIEKMYEGEKNWKLTFVATKL